MVLTDKTRRLGETILITCVVVLFTGLWAQGSMGVKKSAYDSEIRLQVVAIASAMQRYQISTGEFPRVAGGGAYCKPFNTYQGSLCLGELVGPYLDSSTIILNSGDYVYFNGIENVFIAGDIRPDEGVATSNRCQIGSQDFWCVKLPK